MLSRIIQFSTSRPKRVIALWFVIGLALASIGAGFGYKVVTDDTAQFLPKGSDSAQAVDFARTAFGQQKGTQTVTMLVKRTDDASLTAGDQAEIRSLAAATRRWRVDTDAPELAKQVGDLDERAGQVVGAQMGPASPDGRLQLVGLQWKANTTDVVAQEFFRQVRDRAADIARDHDLRVAFTGGVASRADEMTAQEGPRVLSQALLFGSIIALSLLFFRGPLAAVVPLVAIYLVAAAASGLVVLAALAFGFTLDVNTPQLITVVLVGIGVDYFLFLLFRLRERLRRGEDRRTAAANAAGGVGPVIASAALAIVAAFATMLLAEFGQFQVIGPAVGISVLVMLVAGVTLMPAIAAVTGRALFWPSRSWAQERSDGPAARLGRGIARAPGRTALGVTALLVVLSTFAFGTKMSYDQGESDGPSTPATRTADVIAGTFSKGASDPQQVYVRSSTDTLTAAEIEPLRKRLGRVDGVSAVGQAELAPDQGAARVDVALKDDPFTEDAMELVRGPLRDAARHAAPAGTPTLVGGTAAVYADVSDSVARDMKLIFPVAAGLIFFILIATLRSAVAPLYLLTAVVLEFTATLGAAVLVFQQLGSATGLAFVLPLVLFLFVVALGTDYNILMTARLREEMLAGKPARVAVAEAVRHVAPAVAAAGLLLASSFGTLLLESNEVARQQGFAMAFGILLASLVVSSILVPALTALAGQRAWWPHGSPRRHAERTSAKELAPQP
ncbi:MAG: MMPL family transporter, partial [Actinomycetota bacterium]|nr:MMPL family transporter [Actinomycetota bacterium]